MAEQDSGSGALSARGDSGVPGLPQPAGGGLRGSVPSPLRLRNWRVRQRLLALVVIPTVTALAFGAVRVQAARSTAAGFARVEQLSVLGGSVTLLANAVDDERDLTAGFAAARESGDTAGAKSLAGPLSRQYAATDRLLATVQSQAAPVGPAFPAVARSDLALALSRASALGDLRRLAQGQMPPPALVSAYSGVTASLLAFDSDIAAGNSSAQLAQTVSSLASLAQMGDQASQQRAILFADLLQGQFGPGDLQALTAAQSNEASDETSFQATAAHLPAYTPAGFSPALTVAQQFNDTVAGPDVDEAQSIEQNALIEGSDSQPPSGSARAWFAGMTSTLSDIRAVEDGEVAAIAAQARTEQRNSGNSERLTAAVVLLLLLLVLTVTAVIARSMILPLRRLRADALDVAGRRLPEMVRRLSESQETAGLGTAAVGIDSGDEIGEVARAFDQVHREAVRLAGDEAMLRANLNAIFVNLSRRSQALIERQLGIIDSLEQSEQDPGQLSSLFRLDHLATRMRRNSENLLVLAGHETPRKWGQPVPLIDVLRAAVSEIEQYERISLSVPPGIAVAGRTATDVVHLVAELAENATAFSPEDTPVLITSQPLPSHGGVLLNITDSGLGMAGQDLADANWHLDDPPAVDVAVSRRMGLFVVGRLAARHGIRVRLQQAPGGGLTALVWLPGTITEGDAPPPVQPRRRSGAGAAAGEAAAANGVLTAGTTAPAPRRSVARVQAADPLRQPAAAARADGPVSGALPLPEIPPAPAGQAPAPPASLRAPVPPAADTGTRSGEVSRLPIFDSVESDWFRRGGTPAAGARSGATAAGPSWNSPADEGFRAARAAAAPAASERTTAGLPKRAPGAHLVPGTVKRGHVTAATAATAALPAAGIPRSADKARSRMTGFQRGARNGRAAAATDST
jgi:signal transduction histidine kinase